MGACHILAAPMFFTLWHRPFRLGKETPLWKQSGLTIACHIKYLTEQEQQL